MNNNDKGNGFFKRCLLIFLAAAMCISVSSCKKEEKKSALEEASTSEAQTKALEEAKAKSSIDTDTSTDAPASSAAASDTDSAAGAASAGGSDSANESGSTAASGAAGSSESAEQTEYSAGTLSDSAYESAFIGVKFTLPEGAEMLYTSEDIARLNEELANNENEGQRYMKYEMGAQNHDDQVQVIVCVDGNKADYDETNYLAYVAANYENSVGAEVDRNAFYATIAGKQYTAMKIKTKMGNILYCVRKAGDNVISFIVSSPDDSDDKVANMMNAFTPYQ